MLGSLLFLNVRYGQLHYVGIVLCMLGAPLLIFNDWLTQSDSHSLSNTTIVPESSIVSTSGAPDRSQHRSPMFVLLGDVIALGAASCYAASNLCCEHMTKLSSSRSALASYSHQQDEEETRTTMSEEANALSVSPFAFAGLLGLFGTPLSAVQL